jgi:hypothetical protein
MENQGSPRGSPRRSPRRSSSEAAIRIPLENDNDAMLVWRATIDPIKNIGEPFNAEWVYPEGRPDPGRFAIQQNVLRYMMLSYNNYGSEYPIIGWWTPGQRNEYIYVPKNSGQYDDDIPDYYVDHNPVPVGKGLNTQYVSPVKHSLLPLGELSDEWIDFLTQHVYGKGKKYIKNFIDRYIVTPKFTDEHTPSYDKKLRNNILDIFIKAKNEEPGDAEPYVQGQWAIVVTANPENGYGYDDYNMLYLDPNFLNDDFELGILYNKKGNVRVPANRAEIETDFKNVQQYFTKIKQTPEPGTRRRKRERKRDKKILKEEQAFLESTKDNPSAVYDGGRRHRKKKSTRRRGHTMRKK